MSQARSFSLPLACQKTDKKKHHSLFRRLAKALPGRKKKHPRFSADTGDEYGSGNESPNQIDLPHGQFLTPSTSADSLDTDDLLHDEMGSNTSLQATVKLSPSLTVEMLKEVKTLLQNIQSDNKDSQVHYYNHINYHIYIISLHYLLNYRYRSVLVILVTRIIRATSESAVCRNGFV